MCTLISLLINTLNSDGFSFLELLLNNYQSLLQMRYIRIHNGWFFFQRQVTADDNEPPTLELFPLHPTGIAEYKSEPVNSLGLQRSVCNPDENIDEQNNARSGRGHSHNFFYFIPQNPGMQ